MDATTPPLPPNAPFWTRCFHIISQHWQQVPIRVQGAVLVILPLFALILSSTWAYLGNAQRQRAEADVTRKFEMVSNLGESLNLLINAETGMRGYLLSRRPEFLQPYKLAQAKLPETLNTLTALAQAEPGAKPRIEKTKRVSTIRALAAREMKALATLQTDAIGSAPMSTHLVQSKGVMDSLRSEIRLMLVVERSLLSERLQEIDSVRRRDYLGIYLTLFVGLMSRLLSSYLFETGVVRRVRQLRENVSALGRGAELPFPVSGRTDALGDLENAIASAHQNQLEEHRN